MPLRKGVPAAPPRRSRRGPWRDAAFAALDFETTGLDYDRDAVIAFGVVPVHQGRVHVGEAVRQLVAPPVAASPGSMRVHQILPKELVGAPDMSEAREVLARALEVRFPVAWFAEVETEFLARIFRVRRSLWAGRTVDVRRMALALEGKPAETRDTLSATAARYGVPVASPHDALDDALVTAQLFLVLADRLAGRGLGRVKDLLALTDVRAR